MEWYKDDSVITFHSDKTITTSAFIKRYHNIGADDWNRIVDGTQALSDSKIGPKILQIDHNKHEISYQRVTCLGVEERTDVNKAKLGEQIDEIIVRMHSLGYAHGDIHLDNIGFDDTGAYLLDHDSIFRIADGITPWVTTWMSLMSHLRYWDMTFDGFVQLDYQWRHGWFKN